MSLLHEFKCRHNVHDWAYDRETYDGLRVITKKCIWCGKSDVDTVYVLEKA